jgi:hypothetical protein
MRTKIASMNHEEPRGEGRAGAGEAHQGSDADGARLPEADQDALVKPAIRDRPGPRRQEAEAQARRLDDLLRRADQAQGDDVEERGERDHGVNRGQERRQPPHEPVEPPVRLRVAAERRRGREHHDDRRLDDQGQRKDQRPEGREVDVRIAHPGHDRRERRQLDPHHEPARRERPPRARHVGGGQRGRGGGGRRGHRGRS